MAQAVRRRPLTAEDRVRARARLYEICGEECGPGKFFSTFFGFFPVNIIPPWSPYTHISGGGHSSETKCHPIDKNNMNLSAISAGHCLTRLR
jgi:hypothetical protein